MHRDPRKSIPAPAVYIRTLVRRFGKSPGEREQLLRGFDVDVDKLDDPNAEATLFTYVTIAENLCRMIGEHWPLEALETWDNYTQGALEVAVRSAPTVDDGVEVLRRYGHTRGPQLILRLARARSRLAIVLEPSVVMSEAAWRSIVVGSMLSGRTIFRALLPDAARTLELEFAMPRPDYADRLLAALPGTASFHRTRWAITFPEELAQQKPPFADAPLYATAISELERAAVRITKEDALPLRVSQLMRAHGGRLSADQAARVLAMSKRTLVRRLAEGGTTFRELLDDTLRQRARELLDERQLNRDEMADALGFSDPTSFSRACRRWFKSMPET